MSRIFAILGGVAVVLALSAGAASPAAAPDWTITSLKQTAAPAGAGITVLVRSKTRMYAATNTNGDLFRSDDGGVSWKAIHPTGLNQKISDLAVSPTNPNLVWAATWDWGVYRTTNGGKTWAQSIPCLVENNAGGCAIRDAVSAVAVDPTNPSIVYAGTRSATGVKGFGGLYKSTDGGASWTIRAKGLQTEVYNNGNFMYDPTTVFVHPTKPNIVLVGVGLTGIFRSTDGGLTFAKAMKGISFKPASATNMFKSVGRFVYDPATKNILVGLRTTVYRSANDGASWSPSGKGLPIVDLSTNGELQQSPVDPKLLVYIGSAAPGLWGSSDGGHVWKALSTNGLCCNSGGQLGIVDAAVFDNRKPTVIYLGTNENGIYKTTTGAGIIGARPTAA